MDSLPVIFDISSDDDELCCDEPEGDDYNWLSEVLKSVDGQPPDDSDDVVVVSEVNPCKRAKFSKPVEKDFDEDCVILDGDPEKSVGVVNEPGAESDELLIVGEKGQVACRDFPHSRQDCAKFPFNSTPHESHCNLCHCYVCDSIAPCKYWGKGLSYIDHCHATEKEERWKLQRENRKQRKRALPSVPKLPPYVSQSRSHPQLGQVSQMNQVRQYNQVPQHNNIQPNTIIRSTSNPIIPNQAPRPTMVRAGTALASNPVIQNQASRPTVVRPYTSSASNPVIQNQASRPTVIRPCTSSASNPVIHNQASKLTTIRPHTSSASNHVIQNQTSKSTVIRPCTSSTSNPVIHNQASKLTMIRPHTSSASNHAIQNQTSKSTVIRPCTSSASNHIIHNQTSRPNVISACTTSASDPVTQNGVSRLNVIRPCTLSTSNPTKQNEASKLTMARACTPPTNVGTPRVRNHSGGYVAEQTMARNRIQPPLVSQQPVGIRNSVLMQKERGHSIGNPGAKYIPSQRTHQRSLSAGGALPTNQPGYGSSHGVNHAHVSQLSRTRSHPSTHQPLNDRSECLGTSAGMNLQSGTSQVQDFSQTSVGNTFLNTVPSQAQVQWQPISQSNAGQNGPASQVQGNQQPPPVDNFPLESAVPESNLPLPASSNQSLPNFDFEKWLLDSEPLQDSAGDLAEAGMFGFDFENWLLGNEQVP